MLTQVVGAEDCGLYSRTCMRINLSMTRIQHMHLSTNVGVWLYAYNWSVSEIISRSRIERKTESVVNMHACFATNPKRASVASMKSSGCPMFEGIATAFAQLLHLPARHQKHWLQIHLAWAPRQRAWHWGLTDILDATTLSTIIRFGWTIHQWIIYIYTCEMASAEKIRLKLGATQVHSLFSFPAHLIARWSINQGPGRKLVHPFRPNKLAISSLGPICTQRWHSPIPMRLSPLDWTRLASDIQNTWWGLVERKIWW